VVVVVGVDDFSKFWQFDLVGDDHFAEELFVDGVNFISSGSKLINRAFFAFFGMLTGYFDLVDIFLKLNFSFLQTLHLDEVLVLSKALIHDLLEFNNLGSKSIEEDIVAQFELGL